MGTLYINTLFGPVKGRSPGNDNIYTPEDVARKIVKHFKPKGKILEPCAGTGAFLQCLPKSTQWCEIQKGVNFFDFKDKVDWIVTNPPFSKLSEFLEHSMKLSHNIVFLINLPGLFTVSRMRKLYNYKYGIKEILLLRQPTTFVQCGRQVAAVHLQKNYSSDIRISYDGDLVKSYTSKPTWQKKQVRHVKPKLKIL